MKYTIQCLVLALCVCGAFADIYMHNPRGSNNRNNEANTNAEDQNRLFDSQNNAKGGYCWGPSMSYYEGSYLPIEWTNQHGCGSNPRLYCNMVIQYMCTSMSKSDGLTQVRDGINTTRSPFTGNTDTDVALLQTQQNGQYVYGMHEPYSNYVACTIRQRNGGLWLADRNLNTNTAVTTRQSNNGNNDRYGYECPEERDYYPYWAPSPWKDIAILTHNTDWCSFYQSESENVKGRAECMFPDGVTYAPQNQQATCVKAGNVWTQRASHKIGAPACIKAPTTRENHLGNGGDTHYPLTYNWTLPTQGSESCIKNNDCSCALRIRYNISIGDLGRPNGNNPGSGFIDFKSNGAAQSPVTNDPTVTVGGVQLTLALDTTQTGRTFQDRSHTFHIKPRPKGVADTARIWNLNVRGKRGNIVEAYPAVEYDFVPTNLYSRVGDYIHFQWTGCDTNPGGNAGEGQDGTDRSNIVQVAYSDSQIPAKDDWIKSNTPMFDSAALRLRFAYLDQTGCDNTTTDEQSVTNCKVLNAASPYFDGGLVKQNNTGTFYYISTRNNNFSNRDQKGTLINSPLLPPWAIGIVVTGSALFVGGAGVAAAMMYSKANPHSQVANIFNKF